LSDNPIEVLAKLRASLEEEIEKLQEKILELREYTKAIDHFLVKSSLKTADKLKPKEKIKAEKIMLHSSSGTELGELSITEKQMVFTPNTKIKINANAPSFKSFFIPKVLDKFKREDKTAIDSKSSTVQDVLNYTMKVKDSIITKIVIDNYRTLERKKYLIKTLRWALEKAIG